MLELDESNLETTVPTDLTVSSFSDDGVKTKREKRKVETFNERKNFLRDIQLLKLELLQKNVTISNLKTELLSKTSELDKQLKDAMHQKQIAEAKLRTQIHLAVGESQHQLTVMKNDFQTLQQRNKTLENSVQNLKLSLDSFTFEEQEWENLKTLPRETLSLTDYVMLKIYEHQWNVKQENYFMRSRTSKLEKLLPSLQNQLQEYEEKLRTEKAENEKLKEQHEKLLTEHMHISSQHQQKNYAQENFERVRFERDRLINETVNLKKEIDRLKTELLEVIQDKDNAKNEIMKLKQKHALLQKDCDSMSRQLSDVMQRWGESQDKVVHLQSELDRAKSSREEMMARFMRSKDQQRAEFEMHLDQEKNKITCEMRLAYERDIRSLTESKDRLLREKNIAETACRELKKKYEQLFSEYQEKSSKELNLIQQLQKNLTEKENRLQAMETNFNHLQKMHQEKAMDYDKMTVKLQLAEKELNTVKESTFGRIFQLETELGACKARLEVFEKLEEEINEVINEAAQVDGPTSNQSVDDIFQLPVPTNARNTFYRSIYLTRKAMQLERKIKQLQTELKAEQEKNKKITKELDRCNGLLSSVDQPYSYLISTVRENETMIQELNTKIKSQKQQMEVIKKEKSKLQDERSQLINDLELVLKNREEMVKIKEHIQSLTDADQLLNIAQPGPSAEV